MFFQNPKLPEELILNILQRLPLNDAISFLLVSKEMNAFIKDDSIWRKFGANDFVDFATRMKELPDNFRQFILKRQYNYTLALAEDIVSILNLSRKKRQQAVLTPAQVATMSIEYVPYLLADGGIIALRERLITPEQAAAMPTAKHLSCLLYNNSIQALRERLITPEQAAAMPTAFHITFLIAINSSIQALREGLDLDSDSVILFIINLRTSLELCIAAACSGVIRPSRRA